MNRRRRFKAKQRRRARRMARPRCQDCGGLLALVRGDVAFWPMAWCRRCDIPF
jgi:hypothetical protein